MKSVPAVGQSFHRDQHHSHRRENSTTDINIHDDDTVATPPKGQKTGKKECEMTEKTILITRTVEDKDAKVNFRFHHIQILQELNNSFPTMQIYDNNNNIVTDMEDMAKWREPLKYMSHFKLHQKSGNPNCENKPSESVAQTRTRQGVELMYRSLDNVSVVKGQVCRGRGDGHDTSE
jgi:hypothetical protein